MIRLITFSFIIVCILTGCQKNNNLNNWTLNLAIIGSNSSPKCVDLNNDGVLDIVLGAGRNEFQSSDIAVIAVNGKNGDTLWTAPAYDQIYGSPIFQDINNDGIPEVFITGRTMNLMCLDGKNGKYIWKYKLLADDYTPKGLARFNFYNPQFINDINGDNFDDLLLMNSGNVAAAAYDSINRYPGVLMVMSSKSGEILALDTMPDGKESYMTPVMYDFNKDGIQEIIFGTGGETVSGNLHVASLDQLLKNDLSKSKTILKYYNHHGFIAPPIIADFTGDGYKDLLAVNHGGFISLHDGKNDLKVIWQTELPDVELNAQPTIGYFNNDSILDIFINGALGQWPKNKGSRQYFVDGKDGKIMKTYQIGCSGFSSPLTMNVDEDSEDEALLYINDFDCQRYNITFNMTSLFIFGLDTISQFDRTSLFGKNISSTPWIGDLDNDNNLDLISVIAENTPVFHEFLGIKLLRNEYNYDFRGLIKWGSYLNEENKCIYEE